MEIYTGSVKGHLCELLKKYQEVEDQCCPNFNSDGSTRGCDNYNSDKIIYCPFCGIKLLE